MESHSIVAERSLARPWRRLAALDVILRRLADTKSISSADDRVLRCPPLRDDFTCLLSESSPDYNTANLIDGIKGKK